jgi:hypothetical protein
MKISSDVRGVCLDAMRNLIIYTSAIESAMY